MLRHVYLDMRGPFALRALFIVLLAQQSASAELSSVAAFNLITSGGISGDSSDVQGRVLVGGTLGVNNFTFGGQLSNIGGTSSTNGVFSVLGSGVANPNNNSIANTYYATNGSGGSVSNATLNSTLVSGYTNGLSSYLSNLSTAYSTLPNSASTTTVSGSTITFTASPTTINGQSVAVFTVNQSVFTNQNESFVLNGGSSNTTYIINVTGSGALNFATGLGLSSIVNKNDSANILFNFEGATTLNGIPNLGASILAPDAVLSTTNSLVGGVYVKSVTNAGEIDLAESNGTLESGFTGFTPSVVPEPASVVMVALGGGLALGFAARRRRAARVAVSS